ncbi:hypothetical protein [Methyloceanibacter caenitepidi]|uniref:Secreted protein n=1 Tax=Methyloceanibacter caenitepidi TaxID=1384459 RepID=A0A0A8K153_9HYPH|nr:hypothetical protein [Methyloceanibacter caenitepidi]BAQ16650.1 hypothetical protein GL4_1192 [Methyloceanibacter caenitepidi]
MQFNKSSVLALLVFMTLAGSAYAADPADSAKSEAEAIQGMESAPPAVTGSGSTEATDSMSEAKAIEGTESGPASRSGAGPTPATDSEMEAKAIEGTE